MLSKKYGVKIYPTLVLQGLISIRIIFLILFWKVCFDNNGRIYTKFKKIGCLIKYMYYEYFDIKILRYYCIVRIIPCTITVWDILNCKIIVWDIIPCNIIFGKIMLEIFWWRYLFRTPWATNDYLVI